MNILLINQIWFAEEFKALGHNVFHFDCKTGLLDIKELLNKFPEKIDVIFVFDNSSALFIVGWENIDVPIIFYSIDIHHHFEIHKHLTKVFDLTYVAQADYLTQLKEFAPESDIKWLPLWSSRSMEPCPQKEYEAVFVGTLNPKLNPDRVRFFSELQKEIDITVMSGDFTKIFPKSEIVINQTVKGDLNFRIFEAMMSGALLITEEAPNNLHELFIDGEHLVTYKKNDVKDAKEKISYYLSHKDEARRIADNGRNLILSQHLPINRAKRILEDVLQLKRKTKKEICSSQIPNLVWAANTTPAASNTLKIMIFTEALRYLILVSLKKEKLSEDVLPFFVSACFQIDYNFKSNNGLQMLKNLCITYPDKIYFKLAYVGMIAFFSEIDVAKNTAVHLFADLEPNFVINQALNLINEIKTTSDNTLLQCTQVNH